MPSLTKREMKKIRSRLEYIFNKLDGKQKTATAGDGPQDEFTVAQIALSEDIVRVRNKIHDQRKMEQKKESYVKSLQLRNELRNDILTLDESLDKLKMILEMNKASNKFTQKVKNDRSQICSKLEEVIQQLGLAIKGEQVDINPTRKKVITLDELKSGRTDLNRTDENEQRFDEENPDDDRVIAEWQAEDEKLDAKLDDINLILGEIGQMNQNLAANLQERDELIDATNKDATKTNAFIEAENKQLAAVLKKYRAPGKFCLDICLLLVLIGLIAVIIMLAINGKL